MAPRRACYPNCKTPDKRDFMFINPEKSQEDFYRNYDPMVGVATVGILCLFILGISIKSIIKCSIRKYKMWTYDRKLKLLSARQSTRPSKETVTFAQDDILESTNQNGIL